MTISSFFCIYVEDRDQGTTEMLYYHLVAAYDPWRTSHGAKQLFIKLALPLSN